MSVRVLSGDDVRTALTMPDCIEAMDTVLQELAAGELYLPLRSVVRPPKSPGLMGLMTAHRAGDTPAFGAQGRGDLPREPEARPRRPPGRRRRVRRRGRSRARHRRRLGRDRDPHGGRQRRGNARALASGTPARWRCSARACRPPRTSRPWPTCCRSSACASTPAAPSPRRSSPLRRPSATASTRAPPRSVEEALRDAAVVVHHDDRARADRRARLARARGARQRRRVEHPDDARARRRDDGRRAHRRRRPRVGAQRVGRHPAGHARGHARRGRGAGRARRGAERHARRAARTPRS